MDYIRSMVSGKKKRFIEGEFNLDLTYIYPRLVAMAYPAQGIESMYRNPIAQVAKMIKAKHGLDNYHVINLSTRKYDYSYFDGRVHEFQWDDHHAPQIDLLFEICLLMYNFYQQNAKNTIFVHCLAGKGRTGTLICCFLLFIGEFQQVADVLAFYEKQRFNAEGLGVNQPCQKRYIQYFHRVLTGEKIYPSIRLISKIFMQPPVDMNNGKSYYIEFHIVQGKDQVVYKSGIEKINFSEHMAFIDVPPETKIWGDVRIAFYVNGKIKQKKFMRVSFNTAFKDKCFEKLDIDPSQVADDIRFNDNFKLYIQLDDRCHECDNSVPIEKKCLDCRTELKTEFPRWRKIYDIVAMQRHNVFKEQLTQQIPQI